MKGVKDMKKSVIFFLLVILLVVIVPVRAQESVGQACDADSIKDAVDDLIATYLVAKGDASDDASALQAAQDLQDGIASLTTGCAGAVVEATPETIAADATGIDVLKQGKWMLNWSNTEERFCPNSDS